MATKAVKANRVKVGDHLVAWMGERRAVEKPRLDGEWWRVKVTGGADLYLATRADTDAGIAFVSVAR